MDPNKNQQSQLYFGKCLMNQTSSLVVKHPLKDTKSPMLNLERLKKSQTLVGPGLVTDLSGS